MPLFRKSDPYYSGTNFYPNTYEWGSVANTNASGVATYYLTVDGTASGAALFTDIPMDSIVVTPWNSSTGTAIYIQRAPVISADKKTITVAILINSSLLGLGLIPFTTAPSGVAVSLRCRGVV